MYFQIFLLYFLGLVWCGCCYGPQAVWSIIPQKLLCFCFILSYTYIYITLYFVCHVVAVMFFLVVAVVILFLWFTLTFLPFITICLRIVFISGRIHVLTCSVRSAYEEFLFSYFHYAAGVLICRIYYSIRFLYSMLDMG